MNRIDLREFKTVDNHCHLYLPSKEDQPFERYWNFTFDDFPLEDCKSMLIYKSAIGEMARLFGIDSIDDEKSVIEKRNEMFKSNPTKYWEMLAEDAKMDKLIIDTGYPYEPVHGYSITPEEFMDINPTNAQHINLRIEVYYHQYVEEGLAFEETVDKTMADLERDIERYDAVSLKSVAGYFTGLGFEVLEKEEAKKMYYEYLKDKTNKVAEKGVRDYMLLMGLEICLKHNLPMQIHCGFGNGPIMDLRRSNPLMLFDIITHPHYGKVKKVICHCGYPYVAETGYLASQYKNVWADISAITPFASIGADSRLVQLFEMAPLNKVMFGTDGHNIPELYWFGTVYFKQRLANVLDKLVEDNVMSENYAYNIAERILSKNAEEFYRL
ncbi:Amidohydrolase [Dethiosulfatibacter aminovorans DSM 17477]|uniref:Amidohydrolase n=1 Tax=Dethiosulfatibacter aminovorans DSM 17477 TaxID=1121476 RepID=A0A1M6F4U7_9FIRM|nr:amidohydrolase family protein [Dethiosulfatibacter aminovorans]SHI92686.1 Amidohydrolase [Dethiosulfatibacter aminovorans DSM 17477]